MRAVLLLAACVLAGCAAPRDEPPAPAVDVLGSVAVREASLTPATFGEGVPAAPLLVRAAAADARAGEGSGVSLALAEGDARLVLMSNGEWVRTSLRWHEPGCGVTLRSAGGGESTRPDGRVGLDHALGPGFPYHEYEFSGACEGRLFLLWRG